MEHVFDAVVACAFAAALLLISYTFCVRYCAPRDIFVRSLGTFAAGAALCTLSFHLLALGGHFTRVWAGGLLGVLAVALYATSGGRPFYRRQLARDARVVRWTLRQWRRSPYRVATVLFAVLSGPAVARALVMPPLGWDTLVYHAVKAGMWVQHGGLLHMDGPGPWAYYRYVPAGAEVLQAWAMLPTTSDALVNAFDAVAWLMAGLAVMTLARRAGAREPLPSAAAGFVMAVPAFRLMLGSGYAEPVLLSTFLAGLVLVLPERQHRRTAELVEPAPNSPRHRGTARLWLGAASLGVAAASKVSMWPVTGLVMLVVLAREWPRRLGPRRRLIGFAAAYVAMVAPWWIAAAIGTGFPFSPFDVSVGGLRLGASPPELQWYATRAPLGLAHEAFVLTQVFGSPRDVVDGATFLSAIPLLGLVGAALSRTRRPTALTPLLVATLAANLAFYFSPAFAFVRQAFPQNSSRFLLPAIAAATILCVASLRARPRLAGAGWALLTGGALWNLYEIAFDGFSPHSRALSGWVAAAGLVVVTLLSLSRLFRIGWMRWSWTTALVIASLTMLFAARDGARAELLSSDHALHWFAGWRYWAEAANVVDDPGEPHRIAVTSGPVQNLDNWFAYPFMGRQLQNEVLYVPVAGDGRIRHFGVGLVEDDVLESADYWSWQLRLKRERITHVISFSPPGVELGWMEAHPERFERVLGNDRWGLFLVRE